MPKNKILKQKSIDNRLKKLEKAYQEYCGGKKNSLKELSKKYNLHIPDLSKYITSKFKKSQDQ